MSIILEWRLSGLKWRCERAAVSPFQRRLANPKNVQVCTHHYGRAQRSTESWRWSTTILSFSFWGSVTRSPSCVSFSFFFYVRNVLAVLWSLVIQGNLRICVMPNAMVLVIKWFWQGSSSSSIKEVSRAPTRGPGKKYHDDCLMEESDHRYQQAWGLMGGEWYLGGVGRVIMHQIT